MPDEQTAVLEDLEPMEEDGEPTASAAPPVARLDPFAQIIKGLGGDVGGEDGASDLSGEPVSEAAPSGDSAETSKPDESVEETSRRGQAELARQAQEAEARARAAEQELQARRAAEQVAIAEVSREIGADITPEAWEQLETEALDGDYEAAERFKAIKQGRKKYATYLQVAQTQVMANLQAELEATKSYAEVDAGYLNRAERMSDVLKHVYEAGKRAAEKTLKTQVERERAEHEGQRTRLAARAFSTPDSGGRPVGGAQERLNRRTADPLALMMRGLSGERSG